MPESPLIELNNVFKKYTVGDSIVKALDDFSLLVEEGEMCAVMGPSGAGKTTLLNIIGGLDRPDSGNVKVGRMSLDKLNEGQRAKFRKYNVGFIFQFFNLIPSLTALENVMVPVMFERGNNRGRAVKLLERVGLSERMSHLPSQLSGGERQRVAIDRSLINDPMLILADEPTGNIDSVTAREITSLFRELNSEGRTLLLATHDRLVAGRAKTIVRMRDGQVVKGKSPAKKDPIHLSERDEKVKGKRTKKDRK